MKDFFELLNEYPDKINDDFKNHLFKLHEIKNILCNTLEECLAINMKFTRHATNYNHSSHDFTGFHNNQQIKFSKHEFKSLKNCLTYLMTVSGLTALKSDISYLQKMLNREPPTNFVEKLFEIISHAMTAFNRYLSHIRFDRKMSAFGKDREMHAFRKDSEKHAKQGFLEDEQQKKASEVPKDPKPNEAFDFM